MTDTHEIKQAPSVRARREKIVRKIGRASKSRVTLARPSSTFYWTAAIAAGFVMWGLIMVFSSSAVTNLHTGESPWAIFFKQTLWVVVGLTAGFFAYRLPYETWNNQRILGVVTFVVYFANLLVAIRGVAVNGANAWLDVAGMRVQPSEFMKLNMILLAARVLSARHRAVRITQVVLYPMYLIVGLSVALCFMQKDFGGGIVFGGIGLVMLTIAGVPWKQLGATLVLCFVAVLPVKKFAGRASQRFSTFWNLEANKDGAGFQVWQSLLSISNGGLFGTGMGSGTSKWGYVPLAYSDFIFAVIAEEMGFGGVVLLLSMFAGFAYFGIRIAIHARDMHGGFLATGIVSWIVLQAFVHIGGVVAMIPMTGLTLPFISYGGSSLVACMAATGLLLNVGRTMKVS